MGSASFFVYAHRKTRGKDMERAAYMTPAQKSAMGLLPRTHQNCKDKTGVMRPGKTAKDKAGNKR